MRSGLQALLLVSAAASLAACGGGGGSGGSSGGQPTANRAPVFTSTATPNVVENVLQAYRATATDADGDTVTFQISGGDDASLFALNGSQLSFLAAPNFEKPGDANADNIYRVTLTASDGTANSTIDLSINVTNDREGVVVKRVATGLSQPTFVSAVDGTDDVLLITQKDGRIFRYDINTGNVSLWRTIADISTAGEGGLLAIAPWPGVGETGKMFIFLVGSNGAIQIKLVSGPNTTGAYTGSAAVSIPHPGYTNHYGGWLGFGPDGFLYVATGDGGGSGDPDDNAQDPSSRLGKILRFKLNRDPYAGASIRPILTPAPGNPFFNGGGDSAVFAMGLRNPFRARFSGNNLIIGDVGQDKFEEINVLDIATGAGSNFGWPFYEGTEAYRGSSTETFVDPLLQYGHGTGLYEGGSITGGTDDLSRYNTLQYVFGDFVSGNIWNYSGAIGPGLTGTLDQTENRSMDFLPDAGTIDQPVGFELSNNGVLYILDFDGELFRVEPN